MTKKKLCLLVSIFLRPTLDVIIIQEVGVMLRPIVSVIFCLLVCIILSAVVGVILSPTAGHLFMMSHYFFSDLNDISISVVANVESSRLMCFLLFVTVLCF